MNDLLNFFLAADARLMTAALLALSFLVHVLVVNLAERIPPPNLQHYHPLLAVLARLGYELVRIAFYILPLFGALFFGWIDLRSVGLGPLGAEGLDWSAGLERIAILALAAWGFLMLIWMPYLRATARLTDHFTPNEWSNVPRRIIEIILMQAHWAFYRGAVALLANGLLPNAAYWGAVAGVGLVMIEAWSDPRVRRYFMNVGQVEWGAWSAGLAVISAAAYILTSNLWLVAGLHLVLEFSVPHLRAGTSAAKTAGDENTAVPITPDSTETAA